MPVTASGFTHAAAQLRTGIVRSVVSSTVGMLAADHYVTGGAAMTAIVPAVAYSSMSSYSPYRVWPAGYRMRVPFEARGGSFPYVYSISGLPSGASFVTTWSSAEKANYAVLDWPTPVAGTYAYTVRAVDQTGTEMITWRGSLNVKANTDPMFAFIAPSNSGDGARNGSLAHPWISIDEAYIGATSGTLNYSTVVTPTWLIFLEDASHVVPLGNGVSGKCLYMGPNKPKVWLGSYAAAAKPRITCTSAGLAFYQGETPDAAFINLDFQGRAPGVFGGSERFQVDWIGCKQRFLMLDCKGSAFYDPNYVPGFGENHYPFGSTGAVQPWSSRMQSFAFRNIYYDFDLRDDRVSFGTFGWIENGLFHNVSLSPYSATGLYIKWMGASITYRLCNIGPVSGTSTRAVQIESATTPRVDGPNGTNYYDIVYEYCNLAHAGLSDPDRCLLLGYGQGEKHEGIRFVRNNIRGISYYRDGGPGTISYIGNLWYDTSAKGGNGGGGYTAPTGGQTYAEANNWVVTHGTGLQQDVVETTSPFASVTDLTATSTWRANNPTKVGVVGASIE